MSDAPERIYLQLGDPSHMQQEEVDKYPGSWDVSWCDERIWSNDIEYIRADTVPQMSDDERERVAMIIQDAMNIHDPAWRKRLGIARIPEPQEYVARILAAIG